MPRKSTTAAQERLERYRSKRSADQSPEPFGGEGLAPTGIFVVQKHAARRLHYDLRLEIDGVLLSWAVPQGPSLDPAEKRLAVHTEDHPLEYADFEGVIPRGNYGAGAMILWDRGALAWLEEPQDGLARGKLLFELRGYKLRGVWTLVRMKGDAGSESRDWLLIKKPDGYARPETEAAQLHGGESILSGLTIEEMRDGPTRAAEVSSELAALGAPRRAVDPRALKVMLAETRDRAFSDDDWLYELKHDGFRLLAARDGDDVTLRYRSGHDATAIFPDVVRVMRALPFESFVIDGEVVVVADDGRASFQLLQQRTQLSRREDILRAMYALPVTLFTFDLLAFGGFDVRPLALRERKRLLRRLLPNAGPIRFTDHIEARGGDFFAEVQKLGLEGIVAKRADAPYRGGRSSHWLKIRVERTADFVIVGCTRPRGSRSGFGALHLAYWEDGKLVYVGRAGTGFSDAQLGELGATLEACRRDDPACGGPVPKTRGHLWVEPALVCEVRYREITGDGLLRQPVFLRLREDKQPHECPRPGIHGRAEPAPPALTPEDLEPDPADHSVKLTNLDKVFWPDEGYTKGDLIEFYRRVSPWILPYMRDRPVVLTRYPDGIYGKNFFQKDAPPSVPGWVRLERMWSEHAQREIDYFVCDDEDTLILLAQLGSIPLHIWSSRISTLAHPDWCILDLDPKGAPFTHVVQIALALRELCQSIEIEPLIKTSGATGLHVLVPLGRQCTYEQSRSFAELIAKVIEHDLPDIATTTRAVGNRGGRVYVDFLQNGHGRLLVSPLSVRPRPGATVSTPLSWDEVTPDLDREQFTIHTVPARLETHGDPLLRIFDLEPDLERSLHLLAHRLAGG